jgi:hypothetical protein
LSFAQLGRGGKGKKREERGREQRGKRERERGKISLTISNVSIRRFVYLLNRETESRLQF